MSDLLDDPSPGANAPEFSVSELSGAIRRVIEGEFSHVRVRGEVGRVSRPRSGHIYLDLKDDKNVLAGVIWKGVAARLQTQPEEGLEVVATGRLTTFGGQSRYQIVIEEIAPAGLGALMAMLEKRKAQLTKEGLFELGRKRPLPFLPEVIGVVTSPSGAVIRDILHRLRDRFPRKVLLWPVAVQGASSAGEVARAIEGFNRLSPGGALPRPDVLIVARGGGSIEDLWGFNEEIVVRAAAASQIPLISAVGHETDTTLIDLAADVRAPTPTAAAELAVPVRLDLIAWAEGMEARLRRASGQAVLLRRQRLRDLARALPRPERLTAPATQRLDLWGDRLPAALKTSVTVRRVALSRAVGALRPAVLSARQRAERARLAQAARRLAPGLRRVLADRVRAMARTVLRAHPLTRRLAEADRVLQQLARRLSDTARATEARRREKLAALDRLRETLGYRATLSRGYALVRADGKVATTRKAAGTAERLEIEFQDGRLEIGSAVPKRRSAVKRAESPDEQGSLF